MGTVIWSLLLHLLVAQCGFARAALGDGGYNDTFVRQDLADNSAAGAARIVQDNVAPAVTSGDNTYSLTGTTALLLCHLLFYQALVLQSITPNWIRNENGTSPFPLRALTSVDDAC